MELCEGMVNGVKVYINTENIFTDKKSISLKLDLSIIGNIHFGKMLIIVHKGTIYYITSDLSISYVGHYLSDKRIVFIYNYVIGFISHGVLYTHNGFTLKFQSANVSCGQQVNNIYYYVVDKHIIKKLCLVTLTQSIKNYILPNRDFIKNDMYLPYYRFIYTVFYIDLQLTYESSSVVSNIIKICLGKPLEIKRMFSNQIIEIDEVLVDGINKYEML